MAPKLGQVLPLGFPPLGPDNSACASLSLPLSRLVNNLSTSQDWELQRHSLRLVLIHKSITSS